MKCSGTGTVEIGGCSFKLAVKKGKGKISGCACANGGNGGAGSGSGSGNGGEGAGASRCACVSKGMGGTGPSPPTGSGSGPAPTGSGSGSGPEDTVLYRGDLSGYPLALCNDGTTATYYYSGNIQTSDKLLLYMQGGGGCGTVEECSRRCNSPDSAFRCITSNDTTLNQTYTFWSNDQNTNPPFHDFAKVFMHYCSSDTWQGS